MTPDGSSPTHANLLEQQAFLRRLARSLVTDAHRAEDLAQDATLAALESAPANATSLRGWLARVVRNRAINLGLAEERRRAREQAAVHPASPRSPDELEAHFQVQRRVMEAVDRLEEPYRTAILLRYYRDLTPTAIAEQLGVPVATVKSRLARALAQLREQLDDGETRGTHAWVAALTAGLGELHRPAAATALAAGGIAMGVKLALSAVACGALVLGGWWLLRPVEPAPNEAALAAEGFVASPTAVPEPDHVALQGAQIESRRMALPLTEAAPTAEPQPPAWPLTLEIRGFDEQDQGPISIEIHPNGALIPSKTESHELTASLTLDLDAAFEVETRPEQIVLLIDHPAFLPVQATVPVPKELRDLAVHSGELTAAVDLVRAKAIITGKVEITSGFPNAEPRVAIFAMQGNQPAKNPIENARPDAEGRFRLRADGAEQHAVVAHDERTTHFHPGIATEVNAPAVRPETRVLAVALGEKRDIGTLQLGEGESIEGHVLAGRGPTLIPGRARAQLQERSASSWLNLDWISERFELHGQFLELTAAGDFKITGLGPLAYELSAVPKHEGSGKPSWIRDRTKPRVVVTASATGIQLPIDRVMVTIEVRAEGMPVAEAGLSYSLPGSDSETMSLTDLEGRATIELDLSTGINLEATDPRYTPKKLELRPDDLLVSDRYVIEFDGPPLETAQLVLVPHVVDPAQLEGVNISLFLYETSTTPPDELERGRANPTRDASSRGDHVFVTPSGKSPTLVREGDARSVSDLRTGRYFVCISPGSSTPGQDCFLLGDAFEVDLPPGQRVVHDWNPVLGGAVRLEVSGSGPAVRASILGPDEILIDAYFYGSVPGTPGRRIHSGSTSDLYGEIEVRPALPVGQYTLRIRMADKSDRSIPFRIEAGQLTDLAVDLSKL